MTDEQIQPLRYHVKWLKRPVQEGTFDCFRSSQQEERGKSTYPIRVEIGIAGDIDSTFLCELDVSQLTDVLLTLNKYGYRLDDGRQLTNFRGKFVQCVYAPGNYVVFLISGDVLVPESKPDPDWDNDPDPIELPSKS